MGIRILVILFFCVNLCIGQSSAVDSNLSMDDSLRVENAKKYLSKKLGAKFVKDSLVFSGIYLSVLHMVTFEIKRQVIKNNRNMIIVFIDGQKIDTIYNTKIDSFDIKKYYNKKTSKNIFYNKTFALETARKISFEKGIKEWTIEITGLTNDLVWEIDATTKEQKEHPHQASGKSLNVYLNSGKYKISDWVSIE